MTLLCSRCTGGESVKEIWRGVNCDSIEVLMETWWENGLFDTKFCSLLEIVWNQCCRQFVFGHRFLTGINRFSLWPIENVHASHVQFTRPSIVSIHFCHLNGAKKQHLFKFMVIVRTTSTASLINSKVTTKDYTTIQTQTHTHTGSVGLRSHSLAHELRMTFISIQKSVSTLNLEYVKFLASTTHFSKAPRCIHVVDAPLTRSHIHVFKWSEHTRWKSWERDVIFPSPF